MQKKNFHICEYFITNKQTSKTLNWKYSRLGNCYSVMYTIKYSICINTHTHTDKCKLIYVTMHKDSKSPNHSGKEKQCI